MKTCEVCGSAEHPEWKAHVFASNSGASNGASNRIVKSSRSDAAVAINGIGQKAADFGAGQVGDGSSKRCGGKAKQRWSREDYNAYQRELMRKRRVGAGKK